jgi:multidrug resistance efflux pump
MSGQAESSRLVEAQTQTGPTPVQAVRSNQAQASMIHTVRLVLIALIASSVVTVVLTRDDSERFVGYLQTEKHTIHAPVTGTIEFVDFKTGQVVLPGHELFSIRNSELEGLIAEADAEVAKATAKLETAQVESELMYEQRLVSIDQGIFRTKLQLSGFIEAEYQHKFEVTAIEDSIELFDALATTKPPRFNLKSVIVNPQLNTDQHEVYSIIKRATRANQLETLQAKIALCENHLEELSGHKGTIKKQIDAFCHIAELKAEVDAAKEKRDEISYVEESESIKSSVYGMAGVMDRKMDDQVEAGDVLAEFFDRDREFIDVQLPSRVIDRIAAGTVVRLHFPGDIEREGEIETVPPHVTITGNSTQPESMLRLRVLTKGKPWPVVPVGSTVQVSLNETQED